MMTATLLEPPPQFTEPEVEAHEAVLEDRIPPEWKLSRRTAGCVLAFGLLFGLFAIKPLWHTDLWGHLSYGRWIADHRAVPVTEPLMSLSRGVPVVDTAWLSQLGGYLVYQRLGLAGLQALNGLLVTAVALLLFLRVQERTRTTLFGALSVLLFLSLDWSSLAVTRPQLAGLACLAVVLHRVTSRQPQLWDYALVPFVFLLWANLHGSFPLGLGLLGMLLVGRGFDVLRRSGSMRQVLKDESVRRTLFWLQWSAVAVLINPYGLNLYVEVLALPQHPNLASLTEWQPLNVRATHGLLFLASAVVAIVGSRSTPRRIASWEVLFLLSLGIATLWSARFLVWWGIAVALLLPLHAHALARRFFPWRPELPASPTNGKWTIVTAGLLWIFFAYSPLGMKVLHGHDPNPAKAVSASTPVALTGWLVKHPPQGLVFQPYEWGDYLQWAGPESMQVFLNSHAHLVPRDVWQHYIQVMDQSEEAGTILDRYGVNTVILDSEFRADVIRRFKENPKWKLGYEDRLGAVFMRVKPL